MKAKCPGFSPNVIGRSLRKLLELKGKPNDRASGTLRARSPRASLITSSQMLSKDSASSDRPEKILIKDKYNWILDRDPGYGDLLLVCIMSTGHVRRPLIFSTNDAVVRGRQKIFVNWDKANFEEILDEEKLTYRQPNITSAFRKSRLGADFLWQCL